MWKMKCTICLIMLVQMSACDLFIPEIPEECEELGICENVPNYPYEYIGHLLTQETGVYSGQFGPTQQPASTDLRVTEITDPKDEQYEYYDMCPSYTMRLIPKAARDQDGVWRFVFSDSKCDTSIDIVRCSPGVLNQSCGSGMSDPIIQVLPYSGYRTVCDEKKTLRSLPALDCHGNVIRIKVPHSVCCSCVLYKESILNYDNNAL